MLRDQIERYNQRLRDFEEKQRAYRGQQERSSEQELEVGAISNCERARNRDFVYTKQCEPFIRLTFIEHQTMGRRRTLQSVIPERVALDLGRSRSPKMTHP